ncbi:MULTISPECIES: serine hydrolase [unclassified Sphingomonas]|uniref:serine hydrolase n=1 Tax=Sphingomonas TaxID=13687 RepID=UPI00095B91F9|nr:MULTISPECIES: serine hydrolase [unclassified Sphingomonas]MBN8810553.1 serine hydrolase [Sphingomonas sp.]OJY51067.1 MAG: serine hydrolase [Sphingomonas sp. 67-41]
MRHFVLGFALVCAAPAFAQDVARMDKVAAAEADSGAFMGAVLVAQDGRILFDKGYGSANLEWKIPNDGETKFRLGSITKQFTAASILLLQERGKLRLDAPVKTYLPDAPAAWDKVTVFHLLTHSAGIPNFTSFDEYSASRTQATTLDALIARFRGKPLDFAPGERHSYSNSGYVLLTAIIEKASGQPYAAFVAENLFKPLGMADSGYDSHAQVIPHRASGYSPRAGLVVNADYIDMSIPQGAGALYSTTHDLLKWETGLWGGKLLKPELLAAMRTPYKDNYALGIVAVARDGSTTLSHGGGIEGFNTWLGYDPDRRITVVVLANLNGNSADKLGATMMTLARGGTITLPSERKAVKLEPALLKAYEGTYEANPNFSFTLRAEGDRLIAQATRQPPLDLFPEAKDRFFFRAVDAQMDFTRDASGKIVGAVMHQNGRDQKAVRK